MQLSGLLLIVGVRHRPEPVIPSSHDVQPVGHAVQLKPKNPDAQDSQDAPVNPGGQVHVPAAEQTPLPEHGGEQLEDWTSTSASAPDALVGSCATSGTELQSTTRVFALPAVSANQTLEETTSEPAEMGMAVDELATGAVGRLLNADWPA